MPPDEHRRLGFPTREAFAEWIAAEPDESDGLWLRIARAGSGLATVTHAEALEVAIAHGWIDGQRRGDGETHWLVRFTPRRPRSKWSKVNRATAQRLIDEGAMTQRGRREVERAKADGRWDAAYDAWSRAQVPDDLAAAFARAPRARTFFATLSARNRYSILYRIQDAKKPETRQRRIEKYVAMCERGETIHPPDA